MTTRTAFPPRVEIIEVGPRDGLQREETIIPTHEKVNLIEDLVAVGLRRVQVASFVHPKWVPQMADAEDVCARLSRSPDVQYSALALNLKGIQRAYDARIDHIDISISASNEHSRANANRTLPEAIDAFREMVAYARDCQMTVRAGIQCVFGFQGPDDVPEATVIDIVRQHLALGIDELSLADSSGFADPARVRHLLERVMPLADSTPVVLHLHDTRGMGLANVVAALECGVRHFDTAFGGLGGCPFIAGATGNIATEDTVYMLHALGIETGIDLSRLARISRRYETLLGEAPPGKLYRLLS